MRIALATTTINRPVLLELLRAYGPDVAFFVAGDEKTPADAAMGSDAPHFMDVAYQKARGYKCSDLIGFSNIQRRNIATLEAVRWGADVIVHWDDDNVPLDARYFEDFGERFFYPRGNLSPDPRPFNGLKVSGFGGWFDVGQLLQPPAKHRGFPFSVPALYKVGHASNAKIGAAAGMCLGDPDVDAVTRLNSRFDVHGVSELLRSGIVVDPGTKTVFNSQNTAFIRELAPAMFMLPGVGRYDDIYASLICQRVMRERGLHVHFGKPFVWQQRNPHNLTKDLRQEIDGMENVERLAKYLDSLPFRSISPLYMCREIFEGFDKLPNSYDILPKQAIDAALAFLEDIEQVM